MIESTSNKLSFVIGETPVFPFNIRFFKPEDIKCYIQSDGVERLLDAREFSIENKSEYDHGANITLLIDPLPVGETLIIIRECEIVQDVSFPTNGKFPSKSNENALDKLTMIAQQQAEQISRCLKSSVGNVSPDEIVENISKSVTAAQSAAAEAVKAAKDAIEAADNAQSFGGTSIGSFITSPSPIPPPGAYRLNGQTIECGEELYHDFFDWVTTSGVRIIDNDTYESELAETGVCGGFVVTGTSVRLPSNTTGTFWGSDPDKGNGGQSLAAGLPNITGEVGVLMTGGDNYNKGAFQTTGTSSNWYGGGGAGVAWADFDASRCNDAYGAADTVQPTATGVYFFIKVYGAATKLGEQESAQLASEMQFKAQTDLGNVTNPTQGFKDMAIGWGMPDYSAGVDITSSLNVAGAEYEVPCDCLVSATSWGYQSVSILTQSGYYSSNENCKPHLILHVDSGDGAATNANAFFQRGTRLYTFVDVVNTGKIFLYPLKGVEK